MAKGVGATLLIAAKLDHILLGFALMPELWLNDIIIIGSDVFIIFSLQLLNFYIESTLELFGFSY